MNSRLKQEELSGYLNDIRIGIESEALRMSQDGNLAATPHPFSTEDRYFTKDFAESQLEIVTDAHSGTIEPLERLNSLVSEAEENISMESLWPLSMPPQLPDDREIAIARFEESDSGRRKHLYRKGLAARYGKKRQLISGIHVNISMGDGLLHRLVSETSDKKEGIERLYLKAAGRFYRTMDILVLLTGSSPIAGGFVSDASIDRRPVVSLRNGSDGYSAETFNSYIDLSSTSAYVEGMERGIRSESPKHRSLGLVDNGQLIQLSNGVFQSEKEFYAPIRLRSSVRRGETQIQALKRGGPGYLELRFLDKDPFVKGGLGEDTLNLIHLLFLDGLTGEDTPLAREELDRSLLDALRSADLPLEAFTTPGNYQAAQLIAKAKDTLIGLKPLAGLLDNELKTVMYTGTLKRQLEKLSRPETLPSAVLNRRFQDTGMTWTEFGLSLKSETLEEKERELSYSRI